MKKKAVVVGAGIVGLAMARALARKGWQVVVAERHPFAAGASVRNFGMVWPVGQPVGPLLERALRSRSVWLEFLRESDAWYEETGSLLVLRSSLEKQVAEEFVELSRPQRPCELLTPQEALERCPALVADGLQGAIWSPTELIVDPRQAIPTLAAYLQEKWGVQCRYNFPIQAVECGIVISGNCRLDADLVLVCAGEDIETLFPEHFAQAPLTKCRLQMLRTEPQPDGWRLCTALCAGLTLLHYKSYEVSPSLPLLREKIQAERPLYIHYGIHVMASQHGTGEITLGDSHLFGLHFAPFDNVEINDLILNYLRCFVRFPSWRIAQTWHGIYIKTTDGSSEFVSEPLPGVWIINGLGGAGMTLSFGLAEEFVEKL